MQQYVFSVGRPDFGNTSVADLHRRGYKAGLLYDPKSHTERPTGFDEIIDIDFDDLDASMHTLEPWRGRIAGLLCTYENYLLAKSRIGSYLDVPGLNMEAAKRCTDKALMRQAFAEYDPSITPLFATIQDEQTALEFAERVGYPVIIKPTNLVKSLLVLRCNSPEELKENVRYASREITALYQKYRIFDREPRLIIEQFITGRMYSVAAFVDANGSAQLCPGITALTTAQSLGRDDNYLYCRSLPATTDAALAAELERVSTAGVAALGLTSSPAHIELIASENAVKLVEIGARIGGYRPRMYQASYGLDLIGFEIDTALGLPISPSSRHLAYTAVFELFPSRDGAFTKITGDSGVEAIASYYSLKVTSGEKIGLAKHGFKAALVIIISSPDRETFIRNCQMVDTLSVEVAS